MPTNYKRISQSAAQLDSKLQNDPLQDQEIVKLKQKISELEQHGATPEQIAQAVQQYLAEHPITPAPTTLTTDDVTEDNQTQRQINLALRLLADAAKTNAEKAQQSAEQAAQDAEKAQNSAVTASLDATNATTHLQTIRDEIEQMKELESTDPALIAKVAENKASLTSLAQIIGVQNDDVNNDEELPDWIVDNKQIYSNNDNDNDNYFILKIKVIAGKTISWADDGHSGLRFRFRDAQGSILKYYNNSVGSIPVPDDANVVEISVNKVNGYNSVGGIKYTDGTILCDPVELYNSAFRHGEASDGGLLQRVEILESRVFGNNAGTDVTQTNYIDSKYIDRYGNLVDDENTLVSKAVAIEYGKSYYYVPGGSKSGATLCFVDASGDVNSFYNMSGSRVVSATSVFATRIFATFNKNVDGVGLYDNDDKQKDIFIPQKVNNTEDVENPEDEDREDEPQQIELLNYIENKYIDRYSELHDIQGFIVSKKINVSGGQKIVWNNGERLDGSALVEYDSKGVYVMHYNQQTAKRTITTNAKTDYIIATFRLAPSVGLFTEDGTVIYQPSGLTAPVIFGWKDGLKGKSWHGTNFPFLSLAVFSDCHEDDLSLQKNMAMSKMILPVKDIVHLGDFDNNYHADYDQSKSSNMLFVVGNHESMASGRTATSLEMYNAYLSDNLAQLGVIFTEGRCYYYKDYTKFSIRLIVLDCINCDADEIAWLNSTLSNAKSIGYHVITCSHFGFNGFPTFCNFDSFGKDVNNGVRWNEYNNKSGAYSDVISAISAFIDNGGNYICHLHGHNHWDSLYLCKENARIVCVGIDCNSVDKAKGYSDMLRCGEDNYVLNYMSFDTAVGYLYIVRFGSHVTLDGRVRQSICFDYVNGKVVREN